MVDCGVLVHRQVYVEVDVLGECLHGAAMHALLDLFIKISTFSCVRILSELIDIHFSLMSQLDCIVAELVPSCKDLKWIAVGVFVEQLLHFNTHLHRTLLVVGAAFIPLRSHLFFIHGLSMHFTVIHLHFSLV